MRKKIKFSFVLVVIIVIAVDTTMAKASTDGNLLPDGVFLKGVEGKLVTGETNKGLDRFFFEFTSDVNNAGLTIKKGRLIEILPADILAGMREQISSGNIVRFRLWSRVTQYKGDNYLFPAYYLPIIKKVVEVQVREKVPVENKNIVRRKTEGERPQELVKQHRQEESVNEANDILSVPAEVLKKIEGREAEAGSEPEHSQKHKEKEQFRTVTRKEQRIEIEVGQRPLYKPNQLLTDRLGHIIKTDNKGYGPVGKYQFAPNALGQGLSQESFIVLPCQVLEEVEEDLRGVSGELRYEIAGIITKYEGRNYLLLHRAIPVHSYGNFIR